MSLGDAVADYALARELYLAVPSERNHSLMVRAHLGVVQAKIDRLAEELADVELLPPARGCHAQTSQVRGSKS